MNIEKTIPFSWKSWDEQDVLHNTYYDVEFLEDFGSFKKGERFSSIDVNYGSGVIEAYDDNGQNIIKKVYIIEDVKQDRPRFNSYEEAQSYLYENYFRGNGEVFKSGNVYSFREYFFGI